MLQVKVNLFDECGLGKSKMKACTNTRIGSIAVGRDDGLKQNEGVQTA
jgi:hypothetical protein